MATLGVEHYFCCLKKIALKKEKTVMDTTIVSFRIRVSVFEVYTLSCHSTIMTRPSALCRRCFCMLTPSLSATDIVSAVDEFGRSTRVLFGYSDFVFVLLELPFYVCRYLSQRKQASVGASLFHRTSGPNSPIVYASFTVTWPRYFALRAIFVFLRALATRLRVMPPGHIYFRIWMTFHF